MKRRVSAFIITFFSAFAMLAGTAAAHVTLDPKTAPVGRQKYWLNVPNEKDISTTRVVLQVPDNIDVTGILPPLGWHYQLKTAPVTKPGEGEADGDPAATTRISEITWLDGEVRPNEYMQFGFATNYTGDPTTIKWKAYQTYTDGSVVAWDNSSDEHPGPSVTITAKSQLDTLTDQVNQMQKDKESEPSAAVTTWLAVGGAVLAVLALAIALRNRR